MAQEDQKVQDLPDITSSSNHQHIMVITDTHSNQLRKEKIEDFIKDFVSTDENNGLKVSTDGKLHTTDTTNADNITSGVLDKNRLPDSGVEAKTYTFPETLEVDEKGRVKKVTNGTPGGNNADKDLSNITEEGKEVIKQNSHSGASLPIGFIGMCAFGIDETRGLARYLNGSIMAINANTQAFVDKLSAAAKLYPSILCTEEQWQATVTLSAFGQCGQFVLDEEAGTVRLPKIITPIQGLTDLASLGEIVEAGLPNIKGTTDYFDFYANGASGAFSPGASTNRNYAGSNPGTGKINTFDASRSSAVYGKSNTVQQEAVQIPYFIQVATGVEEEVSITNTFEINNPYTLLQPLWSDKKLNNPSWLRSNGQNNQKAEYPPVYDLILEEYNSAADETETVGGVEITFRRGVSTGMKVTTDKSAFDSILEAAGTAWYYVIDTASEVFYLPQSDGFMQFGGDGDFVEAGLPNIEGGIYGLLGAVGASADKAFYISDKSNNNLAGASDAYPETQSNYNFDASRSSAVYGKSTTVQPNATKGYLYFYVGETIQNANIVNIGRLEEQLIEKTNPSQAAHAAMPDYNRSTSFTLPPEGSSFTVPYDCELWFTQYSTGGIIKLLANNSSGTPICEVGSNTNNVYIESKQRLPKGLIVYVAANNNPKQCIITPLMGVK